MAFGFQLWKNCSNLEANRGQKNQNKSPENKLTQCQLQQNTPTNFDKKPFFFVCGEGGQTKKFNLKAANRTKGCGFWTSKQEVVLRFLFFCLLFVAFFSFLTFSLLPLRFFLVCFLFNGGSCWLRPTPDDCVEVNINTSFCVFYISVCFL